MRKILKGAILIVLIIALPFLDAHAEIIWQIGDATEGQFLPREERVITYDVPLNWKEIQDEHYPDWGEFPLELYSEAAGDNRPREVRINFDYPGDLNNPRIWIKAILGSPAGRGIFHNLVICKGEDTVIGEPLMDEDGSVTYVELPVGYLKRGTHDENRIILRVDSESDIPVAFYTLMIEINDGDSDGDGVSDWDEVDEEMLDDGTIAALPIRSYDPKRIERIILSIQREEGSTARFRGVGFMDVSSANLPGGLLSAHYFPYGFLGFRVEEVNPQGGIVLRLRYPGEGIYPNASFYASLNSGEWREVPFEVADDSDWVDILLSDGGEGLLSKGGEGLLIDGGKGNLSDNGEGPLSEGVEGKLNEGGEAKLNDGSESNPNDGSEGPLSKGGESNPNDGSEGPLSKGGEGNHARQVDGSMDVRLTLAYPRGLGVEVDRTGCFIRSISERLGVEVDKTGCFIGMISEGDEG